MGRFSRSFSILGRSFEVIGGNKKLLLFPIVTTFFLCILTVLIIAPLTLVSTGHPLTDPAHWKAVGSTWFDINDQDHSFAVRRSGVALFAVLYFVSMFFATFFNVAFYNEILKALQGQPVSIRGGLKFAMSRVKAIAAWSLFTGLIGAIIKSIEERVGLVGKLVVKLIGLAWAVASVFAIPVLVREESSGNPINVLKSSASLVRKTWGETLIGYVGLSIAGLLVFLEIFVVGGASIALAIALGSPVVAGAGILLAILGAIAMSIFLNVAGDVYKAALYLYAADGIPPGPFNAEEMNAAWKTKPVK
ncbi:MAG: hypothetical protein K1X53_15855 [Candidatus Sumerlaeaceae bacterium]|nr:hypothetical protein [Candidatus Sumerlaeaceae bacterium]